MGERWVLDASAGTKIAGDVLRRFAGGESIDHPKHTVMGHRKGMIADVRDYNDW